jgi:hypothetical protein
MKIVDFPSYTVFHSPKIFQAAEKPSFPCDLRCLVPQIALCKRIGGRGIFSEEDVEEIQEKTMESNAHL